MLFQLNPSSSMIINRARLTSAAGETRDRVNDTNARRSSLVRLKTDCMLHIVLLKSMLHNTSHIFRSFLVSPLSQQIEKDLAVGRERAVLVIDDVKSSLPLQVLKYELA